MRRCPKLRPGEEKDQRIRQSHPDLQPDPNHPDACLRLHAERLRPDLRELIGDWSDYGRGHLLRRGGIADQPVVWLETMRVIDSEMGAIQREELDRQRSKHHPPGADPSFAPAPGFKEAEIPYGRKGKKKPRKQEGEA